MENKIKFRDFDVRVWGDGDLSMDSEDMSAFIGKTHKGVQTNSEDTVINTEIETICSSIRNDFRILNELLNKIEKYGK